MEIPTKEQYLKALKIKAAYEENVELVFKDKMRAIKKDLDTLFANTEIKKYMVGIGETFGFEKEITLMPTEPEFNEDYNGEFDAALIELGKKHNVLIHMDSDIYAK